MDRSLSLDYSVVMKKLLKYLADWWSDFPYNGFSKDPEEREEQLADWQSY